VRESATLLEALGAQLTLRIYPGMGHTIHPDEISLAQGIISTLGVNSYTGTGS
jgi:predicted esterase